MSHQASVVIVRPGVDNVAVAAANVIVGQRIDRPDLSVSLEVGEDVPLGHLIAIRDIPAGEAVIEYGQPLGISRGCQAGQRITHDRIENRLPETGHQACSAALDLEPLSEDEIPT